MDEQRIREIVCDEFAAMQARFTANPTPIDGPAYRQVLRQLSAIIREIVREEMGANRVEATSTVSLDGPAISRVFANHSHQTSERTLRVVPGLLRRFLHFVLDRRP